MKRQLATAALAIALLAGLPAVAAAGERVSHPTTAAGVAAVKRGDYVTAFRHFRDRAAAGDAEAQFELGMLYALGNGVERDYVAAWKWSEIAARQKEPYADFIRDEVAANMKPNEIGMARREADAWMRANKR